MPLHVPPAPAPALRSVLAALGSPTAVHEAHTPALRALQGPVTAELPLPVHVLDRLHVSGLTAGGRPPRTRLTGWRFLIRSGDRYVAAADTRLTPDGWAFSHFFEGPYVAATERALGKVYGPRRVRLLENQAAIHVKRGDAAAAGRCAASYCSRPPMDFIDSAETGSLDSASLASRAMVAALAADGAAAGVVAGSAGAALRFGGDSRPQAASATPRMGSQLRMGRPFAVTTERFMQ
jgi:hypothetical protein